jgi:hypothetical protein
MGTEQIRNDRDRAHGSRSSGRRSGRHHSLKKRWSKRRLHQVVFLTIVIALGLTAGYFVGH